MASLLYIIAFLEEKNEKNFIDTPHLTLMPDFSVTDKELPYFLKDLQKISAWFHPLKLKTTTHELLGPFEDIPVVFVGGEGLQRLRELHSSIFELIYEYGGKVTNPEYCLDEFKPHISGGTIDFTFELDSFECIHHSEGFGIEIKTLKQIQLIEKV